MRIALLSDAWHPQINGVVTTVKHTVATLGELGHDVELITPDLFKNYPWPGYPDVRMAFLCGPELRKIIHKFKPDALHLVTEGCIGFAARRFCREFGYRYTSSYLSQFPEYFKLRIGFPKRISEQYLRWFHSESERIMVSTPTLESSLQFQKYANMVRWSRGVDTELFKPADKSALDFPRPVFMYVGRVAVEKNIAGFLQLDLPGTKIVVGDGTQREELSRRYPDVHFTGYMQGENLARMIGAADVFVFPSQTDTFGVVLLEALACGVPVAAFPVQGPKDVILSSRVGVLSHDLRHAALAALTLKTEDCRNYALNFTWKKCTEQFVNNLVPMR